MEQFHGTTIMSVRRDGKVALGGDGQVTLGQVVVKASARKVRRLEAMLAVADRESSLIITGTGDVIEPELGLIAIGSGGPYAQSAARALLENTQLDAETVVRKSLSIAADLCIYTNQQIVVETLD
ncbi:MAG TPA: hypothetical protein VK583_14655 [Burkholderiales bacterium]|nr:hypothetical protein [Burkholderiales bacterium]